jgi:hypothetical protein
MHEGGGVRNIYKILVGRCGEKRPFRRINLRWKVNIKNGV